MKRIVLSTVLLTALVASGASANSFKHFFTKDMKHVFSQQTWNPKNNGLNKFIYGHSNPDAYCHEHKGSTYKYRVNAKAGKHCVEARDFNNHSFYIGVPS